MSCFNNQQKNKTKMVYWSLITDDKLQEMISMRNSLMVKDMRYNDELVIILVVNCLLLIVWNNSCFISQITSLMF